MSQADLSRSMEDYLETIYVLLKDSPVARAKEIAEKMGVKMSSVTNALKQLSEKGHINYDKYSYITLTESGEHLAKEIFDKHTILKEFLIKVLCCKEEKAEDNACRMEHVMDQDVIDRISSFMDFILKQGEDSEFITKFKESCK